MFARFLRAPRSRRPLRPALSVPLAALLAGFLLAAALLPLAPVPAFAADSGFTGTIKDAETGEPLGFANLVYNRMEGSVAGTAQGTISDETGTFDVAVAPGIYRVKIQFIGYKPFRKDAVLVRAGEKTRLDVALEVEAFQGETIRIKADAIKNTDASLLVKRQLAGAVQDGISAEQIRTSTDSNAAEVVTRVTGVTLVDGKYVYVRGLGERYSSAQVNGSTVASPEANRRVLPFDIFPAGFLENVVIQKTYTPDQPGDFGGGSVNVSTLDFPSKRSWVVSVGSGAHNSTTGKDFATYEGGGRDYLGFDDGTRDIPDLVQQLAGNQAVRLRGIASPNGFTAAQVESLGEAFNKTWSRTSESAGPAMNFAASYGDEIGILGMPLGVVAAATLNNSFKTYEYDFAEYQALAADGSLEVLNDFDVTRSSAETLLGGLVNAGWKVLEDHRLNLRAMYNHSSEDQVKFSTGPTDDLPVRRTRLRFVERSLFSASAGTSHQFDFLNGTKFEWRAEISEAEQDEPDRRSYDYELRTVVTDGDTTRTWELNRRSSSAGLTRAYSYLDDTDRNYAANLVVPFPQWSGLDSQLKLGWAEKNKDRDSAIRRFAFRSPTSGAAGYDFSLSPEELLTDENIGGNARTFRLEELTRASDAYKASHDITARYALLELPIWSRLRFTGGVRVEDSDLRVTTSSPIVGAEPEVGRIDKKDTLPAANFRLAVTDRINLRGAFSRTLNRPDLRELTSQEYTDYDRDRSYIGNPELEQAELESWDLRFEVFPSPEETIAISAFTKSIDRPIEYQVYQGTGGGELVRQPYNGEKGTLDGVEFEARMGLGRVWSGLDRFGMSGNLTLIDSEVEIALVSERKGRVRRKLTGQSDYVANVALQYQSAGGALSGSVQYNVFGERLDAAGPVDELGQPLYPDVFEQPRHLLDLTSSYRLGPARLKLSVENILGEEYEARQGEQVAELRELGRTVSLTLGYGSR